MLYLVQGEDGRIVARGKTIQVMYDYMMRNAFPIPDEIKAFVRRTQGSWMPPSYP
jgi:acyl-CoA thioesterase FadM